MNESSFREVSATYKLEKKQVILAAEIRELQKAWEKDEAEELKKLTQDYYDNQVLPELRKIISNKEVYRKEIRCSVPFTNEAFDFVIGDLKKKGYTVKPHTDSFGRAVSLTISWAETPGF